MSVMQQNPENYALFRDCLSTTLLRPASSAPAPAPPKRRRRSGKSSGAVTTAPVAPTSVSYNPQKDAEELADFADYLATEIFESLPEDLQVLDYRTWRDSEDLQRQFSLPLTKDSLESLNLPPSVPESLSTYNLVSPSSSDLPSSLEAFLIPILTAYITSLTAPPPSTTLTRADACELCDRSWIPLTYHHLIPRFVHEKAVKRGWHKREDLQNVAWLCGACHRFVHNFKTHEELARDYHTVDLLLKEDEVRKWAAWVSKLRWKGR